jgi:hypothetical protein
MINIICNVTKFSENIGWIQDLGRTYPGSGSRGKKSTGSATLTILLPMQNITYSNPFQYTFFILIK